jgi:probable HAF family extracellular repeat protein
MKSAKLIFVTPITFFAALAVPALLAAQQHARYRFIDLGTLGGPTNYLSVNGGGNPILNNAGIVSSSADTSLPDPNAPGHCFNPDCFLTHAYRWQDGVLTDIGALPGVNSSAAGAINELGWSAGQSQNGLIDPLLGVPETRAVLWTSRGIINLGTLGGYESLAVYVNNGGQVVGLATNAIPDPYSVFGWGAQIRTFLWESGVMRDLGTLGGPDATPSASCTNQRNGLIAGASYVNFTPNPTTGVPTIDPFLWNNGAMLDLGTLGGTNGFAQCANNRGQVTGTSNLAGDITAHAFLWDRGTLSDLRTLGGTFSTANWLNDRGDVVGGATTPGDTLFHATLWRKGGITDLGTLDGDCFSQAFAINSEGQIVGQSFSCDFSTVRAVLWENGSIIDLNTVIPTSSNLFAVEGTNINDRGEILGQGLPPGAQNGDNGGHLFVLIPCAADDEGCHASTLVAGIRTQRNEAPTSLTPREIVTAWRARLAQRYHIPGLGAAKRD